MRSSFPVIEQYRNKLRDQTFERLDDAGMVKLRRDSANAHQNSAIAGIHPPPEVKALFDMFLEERVPPHISEPYVMRYVTEQLVPSARTIGINEDINSEV